MANICSSIELEPRTLNEGQLNHVREAAVDVVQNMQPNKASDILIKGLMSNIHVRLEEMESKNGMGTDNEHNLLEECKEKCQTIEKPCQCALNNVVQYGTPDLPNKDIREPLSAPF